MIKLTPHQQEVFNNIVNMIDLENSDKSKTISVLTNYRNAKSKMCVLHGPAGCGKSTLTAELIKHLMSNYDIVATSPTHKASSVLTEMINEAGIDRKASTIHSFLRLKQKIDYEKGIETYIVDVNRSPNKTDILIVDECSMINEELFTHIQDTIKKGDVKFVIFVGDIIQLPPVGEKISKVFELKNKFPLTEVVRQALDSGIIRVVTKIRTCIEQNLYPSPSFLINYLKNLSYDDVHVFDDFNEFMGKYFDDEVDDKFVCTFKNQTADEINGIVRQIKIGEDIPRITENEKVVFQAPNIDSTENVIHANNEIVTVSKVEDMFDDELNINYHLCTDYDSFTGEPRTFKLIANDDLEKWSIYLHELSLEAKKAKGEDKKFLWEKFFKLKKEFQDIKYSYSGTTHKAQGSGYKICFVYLDEIIQSLKYNPQEFVFKILYTAMTRSKKELVLLV